MVRPRLYPDLRTTWRENKRRQRKEKQAQLKVYHRSLSEEWETPQSFFDTLHAEWRFTLDVAATPVNTKCQRYFTREDNGLTQAWGCEMCWMNPPYGRALASWIRKAYESAQTGATVVCLIPARTDTQWWHTYVEGKAEVRTVPGRLKFSGARYNAPFPSVLVIFRPPGG
jgi:phage N-6-adenine-methyltransferase